MGLAKRNIWRDGRLREPDSIRLGNDRMSVSPKACNQELSLIVPVLNEQEVLRDTYETLIGHLEALTIPFEVIVVDNGSVDATPEIMREICDRDPRWKYLRLSRNFGYQNSITAGML